MMTRDVPFYQERKANSKSWMITHALGARSEGDEAFSEEESHAGVCSERAKPFDEDLAAGQIRILSDLDEITYVVLLRRWESDSFVVCPFSHYDAPATEDEILTDTPGGLYQEVLQVWNIRTLQDETLKRSWCTGTLPAQDCDDAWQLWRWTMGRTELSERILKKTGLPIYRDDDPRIAYKQEVLRSFAALDQADLAVAFGEEEADAETPGEETEAPTIHWAEAARFRLAVKDPLLAVAGEEERNIRKTFRLPGLAVFLMATWAIREKRWYFSVFDAEGENTSVFDGYAVYSGSHEKLGVLDKGLLSAADESGDGSFFLIDRQGNSVALDPME